MSSEPLEINMYGSPFLVNSIPSELVEQYAGEKLKTVLSNKINTVEDGELLKLKPVFFGTTIEGQPTIQNIEYILELLNKCADEDLVSGVLHQLAIFPLAIMSIERRCVAIITLFSSFTKSELNEKLGKEAFYEEGALPNSIKGIPWFIKNIGLMDMNPTDIVNLPKSLICELCECKIEFERK